MGKVANRTFPARKAEEVLVGAEAGEGVEPRRRRKLPLRALNRYRKTAGESRSPRLWLKGDRGGGLKGISPSGAFGGRQSFPGEACHKQNVF